MKLEQNFRILHSLFISTFQLSGEQNCCSCSSLYTFVAIIYETFSCHTHSLRPLNDKVQQSTESEPSETDSPNTPADVQIKIDNFQHSHSSTFAFSIRCLFICRLSPIGLGMVEQDIRKICGNNSINMPLLSLLLLRPINSWILGLNRHWAIRY